MNVLPAENVAKCVYIFLTNCKLLAQNILLNLDFAYLQWLLIMKWETITMNHNR